MTYDCNCYKALHWINKYVMSSSTETSHWEIYYKQILHSNSVKLYIEQGFD